MTGWNFSGQNVSGANFTGGTLSNANLAGANLTNSCLLNATLSNANLSGADLRGATWFSGSSAVTNNTILPDGTVHDLTLDISNPMLLVRNYSGNIPIHVQQGMILTESASLVLEFDGNPWGSTISFASGVPVTLGGNLELDLVAGVNPARLVGDTYQVFDWTGVSPSGQFANITNDLPPGYTWDTSQLYTTGDVTLTPEPSTLALLAAGALGLLGYDWRRRWASRRTSKPAAFDHQDAPAILSLPSHSSHAHAARRAA